MAKVCVVGLGYIGLPTSALLASHGHQVVGVDINPQIVEKINNGQPHFEENGLAGLLHSAVSNGRLKASITPETSDIYLIIVPTPFVESDKSADMSYVHAAVKSIAPYLQAGQLVVLESTSGLGATKNDVQAIVENERPDLKGQLHFAFCPERAIPGNTLHELEHNDRVVGGVDEASTQKAVEFYKTFVKGQVLGTSSQVAEMVKLSENAFRDVNIAFANELSLVCDHLGINVWEVIKLANHHPRVNILQPGPGVGGHCIAIDPWFIVSAAPQQAKLMATARDVNDGKPYQVLEKVKQAIQNTGVEKPVVGLLGLAFKPNVDDLRESPALKVANLIKENIKTPLIVCEPFINNHPEFELVNQEELLQKANVVVMLTDHDAFKNITIGQLAGKQIVDTRGTFS